MLQQDSASRDGVERAFLAMAAEWSRMPAVESPVQQWESRLLSMQAEVSSLVSGGRWRSGGRTLMHALGLQHNEVMLSRGLAWLLTPDGWHGLGDRFLVRLLDRLALPSDAAAVATVVTEEVRGDCRADIVIRAGSAVVVIEAKVFAGEQTRQADRLQGAFGDEASALVFLTRDGRLPETAVESAGAWIALTWTDLAVLLGEVVPRGSECAPGVGDFLQTLHHYER